MMRGLRAFGHRRFRRADLEVAIHRDRIAVDDLTVEAPRERQRQRGLPAGGRAKHNDEQGQSLQLRRTLQRQRALQEMYGQ